MKQSIFRTALSWVFLYLGIGVEKIMFLWGPLCRPLHPVYNLLMGWSVDLDKAGKIWNDAKEEE